MGRADRHKKRQLSISEDDWLRGSKRSRTPQSQVDTSGESRTATPLPAPSQTSDAEEGVSQTNLTTKNAVVDLTADEHDVCLGYILLNAHSSFERIEDSKNAEATFQVSDTVLKLYLKDTGKYAGFVESPVICQILSKQAVRLVVTLITETDVKKQGQSFKMFLNKHYARIMIYGLRSEAKIVGKALSDGEVYLQQPSVSDVEDGIKYFNPQYFVPPDGEMPSLEELSLSSETDIPDAKQTLDELTKNSIMKIFDSTYIQIDISRMSYSTRISSPLKSHQVQALAFMIEKESGVVDNPIFPPLWEPQIEDKGKKRYRHTVTGNYRESPRAVNGGILADDMGLGKTLSVLALICSSLDALSENKAALKASLSRCTLVVAPKSTIPGWIDQIKKHIHPGSLEVLLYHGSSRRSDFYDAKDCEIVITTYETLRYDWENNGPLFSKTWLRVVLDEAHRVRNRASHFSKAARALSSSFRWCLSGTPIHNSLEDYGALLAFVDVPDLSTKASFVFWTSSSLGQRDEKQTLRLQSLVRSTCLRRTKALIADSLSLPQRTEQIEIVELPENDRILYDFFKGKAVNMVKGTFVSKSSSSDVRKSKTENVLTLINILRLICNHAEDILPRIALEAWKTQKVTQKALQEARECWKAKCQACNANLAGNDNTTALNIQYQNSSQFCENCGHEYLIAEEVQTPGTAPELTSDAKRASLEISPNTRKFPLPSAKVKAILKNIETEQSQNVTSGSDQLKKNVIFSFWTRMLDLIELALENRGLNFERIDGKTTLEGRSQALERFRNDSNCSVLLASISSAGEGIDLTAASRVHIVEPQWNPVIEAQAVDRVYRIGQKNPVVVYRYIVEDSIEKYIQWIQVHKLEIAEKVLNSSILSLSEIEEERWTALQSSLSS